MRPAAFAALAFLLAIPASAQNGSDVSAEDRLIHERALVIDTHLDVAARFDDGSWDFGERHRYAYTTELRGFTADGGFSQTGAYQYDFEENTALAHDFGDDAMPGECVVAPRPGRAAEDDAWLLLFVHRRDGSETELVILDAGAFASPPVARIRMPSRVPFGLHGEWLADAAS